MFALFIICIVATGAWCVAALVTVIARSDGSIDTPEAQKAWMVIALLLAGSILGIWYSNSKVDETRTAEDNAIKAIYAEKYPEALLSEVRNRKSSAPSIVLSYKDKFVTCYFDWWAEDGEMITIQRGKCEEEERGDMNVRPLGGDG